MGRRLLHLVVVLLLVVNAPLGAPAAQEGCPYWSSRCTYWHQQHLYWRALWELYVGEYGMWEYYWLYENYREAFEREGEACNLEDFYCRGY